MNLLKRTVRKSLMALIMSAGTSLAVANAYGFTLENTLSPQQKADKIVAETLKKSERYHSIESTVRMTTYEKNGDEDNKEITFKVLKEKDSIKSLIVFNKPKRERGVTLLSHAHQHKPNQQWLYLPNIRRTRKITAQKRNGSFMGSEFSYSHILPPNPKDFTYTYEGEATIDNRPTWIIKSQSNGNNNTSPASDYQKIWVDQKTFIQVKTEFYDKKGTLKKRLEASDFKANDNNESRPTSLVMSNLQTGRSTKIVEIAHQTNVNLNAEDFTQDALEFAR